MKIKVFLTSLMLIGANLPLHAAEAQHEHGNGGDAYVSEFVRIARKVQKYLEVSKAGKPYGIESSDFLVAIEKLTSSNSISSTDENLYLDGVQKDVKNFPRTKTIIISRPRWKSILENQKDQIVTHEIIGVMGHSDQNYEISSYLFRISDASLEAFGAEAHQSPRNFLEWAGKVDLGLREALNLSYQANTIDEEEIILSNAIRNALDGGSLRNQKFFAATLNSALQDSQEFEGNSKIQVRILREYIHFALDDLSNLKLITISPNDNSKYVINMFARGLVFTDLSSSKNEETLLLESLIRRGLNLFMISDYNRTAINACSITQLSRALEQGAVTADISARIRLYQETINSVLKNGFNCH